MSFQFQTAFALAGYSSNADDDDDDYNRLSNKCFFVAVVVFLQCEQIQIF